MTIGHSSGAEMVVPPEDILRAFGEVHKMLFRLSGTTSVREQQQKSELIEMWASLVCDSYQFDLLFAGTTTRFGAEARPGLFNALEECLGLASRIHVAELGQGETENDDIMLVAEKVIDESRELLLAEWAGTCFGITSNYYQELLRACKPPPTFTVPGTTWEIETRGLPPDVREEDGQPEKAWECQKCGTQG